MLFWIANSVAGEEIVADRKAIFITGGGGGMGLATGKFFADKGWFVGLFDRDEASLEAAATEIGSEYLMTGLLDVTRESEFEPAVQAFGERSGGRMDVLFNNAGIAPGGWFDEMPTETIRQVIEVNIMGVIYGTRAALPMLKATNNALCVSTSSSVATFGHARRAVYSASKFAVKGLTEALSLEFERFGIRTADVLPGCIDTPMLRREMANGAGRPFEESMLDGLPKEGPYRYMPASAIAEAVWAAYEDSSPIHFYVPEEVGDTDRIKAKDINAAREEARAFLFGR
jgi:NAD(P)-dependent dehydrogenase (short-subunit alcohol dehydrogenase family)